MQSIDRSSECARKLKPSDIFSHSYLVVCLFRKYKKEAFECQKWGMSFDILLDGRGKWRKFLATFVGHIWSLWIARALRHFFGEKDEHKCLTWSFNNRNNHKNKKNEQVSKLVGSEIFFLQSVLQNAQNGFEMCSWPTSVPHFISKLVPSLLVSYLVVRLYKNISIWLREGVWSFSYPTPLPNYVKIGGNFLVPLVISVVYITRRILMI